MSNTIQMTPSVATGYVDPRRLPGVNVPNDAGSGVTEDFETRIEDGRTIFVANAGGTTTTLVGANADPNTDDDNVVRRGDKFVLRDSTGALKEDTVFEVTDVGVGASTTVTFSPAAAVATASGDEARSVGLYQVDSIEDIDSRLLALGLSQTVVDQMTLNDKLYQIRTSDDPDTIYVKPSLSQVG